MVLKKMLRLIWVLSIRNANVKLPEVMLSPITKNNDPS